MTSSVMALLHCAGLPTGPLLSRREAMSARVRNLHALSTLGETGQAGSSPTTRGLSAWWLTLLAVLPVACCSVSVLLVPAGVSAGTGALLGGAGGAVLVVSGAAAFGVWALRRRSR